MNFTESYYVNLDCQCNADGSQDGNCNEEGKCTCKSENIAGDKCDQCAEGYSMNGFPACQVIEDTNFGCQTINKLISLFRKKPCLNITSSMLCTTKVCKTLQSRVT